MDGCMAWLAHISAGSELWGVRFDYPAVFFFFFLPVLPPCLYWQQRAGRGSEPSCSLTTQREGHWHWEIGIKTPHYIGQSAL
jgi:hypothetical protein